MKVTKECLNDEGYVEFGFTSFCDTSTDVKSQQCRDLYNRTFSGDGLQVWYVQEVLDAAVRHGLKLARISQMNQELAATEVQNTLNRIHCTLVENHSEVEDIRKTTAQLCMWEATLKSGCIARRVALLKPS